MPQISTPFDLADGLSKILDSLNQAAKAALTGSSGATAPSASVTNPYQFWVDTTVRALRQYGDDVADGSRPLWTLESGPLAIIPKVVTASAYTIPNALVGSGDGLRTWVECDTTSNSITITLPESVLTSNTVVWIFHKTKGSTNTVTVQRSSTDTIRHPSGTGTETSVQLVNQGALLKLSTTGDGKWTVHLFEGVGAIAHAATATLTPWDENVTADATSGAITLSVPAASKCNGRTVRVIKTDASANAVTVDVDGGANINGSSSISLASQYDSAILFSDGSQWWRAA